MWDTSKIAAFTSVVSVLLALGGANLNDGQKNAITEAITNVGKWLSGIKPPLNLPAPVDIAEIKQEVFKFNRSDLVDNLRELKFADIDAKTTCERYDEITPDQFPILIENIGALANLSRVQMDQMKSAVYMGAQIKTQEVFIHGTTGCYWLLKYTIAKTASGNLDMMIAKHGYQWLLNSLDTSEASEKQTVEDMLGEVPQDMLPEEAKSDVIKFIKLQTKAKAKTSLGVKEMDDQVKYFRTLSQNNLDFMCPKVATK